MTNSLLFKAKDENGKMLPSDISFHCDWEKNPDWILRDLCGIEDPKEIEFLKNRLK